MKANMKANLQVVIFSRDRHEQLTGSLRYWHECGIQTLVLHNTQNPLKSVDIPRSTEYIVHQGSFAARCEIASQILKLDFFIIASDDERYLPTALSKMVEELVNSQELASVGGQAIGIMQYGLKYRTTLAYQSQINYLNIDSDFRSRLEFHYDSGQDYSGAMYRVFRQNHFRRFLLLISKFSDIGTPYIFEVTSELFWTLIGPTKYIDEVFWVRNWVIPPIQTGDWDRKQYFYEWSQNPKYKKEFESWKGMVTSEFKTLEYNSEYFGKMALHRFKIEQNEQRRNEDLRTQRFSEIKAISRIISSVFASKYHLKELRSQLKKLGVEVRNDELETALSSITH